MANEKAQAASLEAVREMIRKFTADEAEQVARLKKEADDLGNACDDVNASWSQSSIGHHGSYYYGDFTPPPADSRWSIEWGTIHGVPDGWRARSGDEVKNEVQQKAGGVSIQDFSQRGDDYLKSAKKLKGEIEIELSDFEFTPEMDKEKALFVQMENYDLGDINQVRADYINARVGGSKMSRDSEAMMEGTYVPSHMTTNAGRLGRCWN